MTPLERTRIEKAGSDCGFEMSPLAGPDWIELRSAHFPETITVRQTNSTLFLLSASNHVILGTSTAQGPITADGISALYSQLKSAAGHARTLPNRVADIFQTQTASLPRTTEAERLVIQRVGQDIFREALLDYWQSQCCVTSLNIPQLLRASHIKPWAKCNTDNERLDVYNGLLLAPHIDALFDGGWISFTNNGRLIVSECLPKLAERQLEVSNTWSINKLTPLHHIYLEYHRNYELRKLI